MVRFVKIVDGFEMFDKVPNTALISDYDMVLIWQASDMPLISPWYALNL